jgi:hypothetical protein
MRSLFWKEIRQGRALLVFALAAGLLIPAGHLVIGRLIDEAMFVGGPPPRPADVSFAIVALLAPVFIAIFAGAGLFSGEADHSTVPVLFALPLSRRRIWLAKVLAGLALTSAGSLILLGLGLLLMPAAYRSLPVPAYLPDLCLSVAFAYSVAVFVSAVTSYVTAAFVCTLLFGGALGVGLGALWSEGGAPLLDYNPILDIALWGFLVTPALLFASAVAISRGELLQSWRKHAFALPALVVGLVITVAAVSGIGRYATRYERSEVRSVSPGMEVRSGPVLGLTAQADPVPLQRSEVGKGWTARPYDWEEGYGGRPYLFDPGPVYRSAYDVVLDLHTGRELLTLRRPYGTHGPGIACSPDGRFAAAVRAPQGLTWGTQSWHYFPPRLEVYDLRGGGAGARSRPTVYADVPEPLRKLTGGAISELRWSATRPADESAHGGWLVFTTAYLNSGTPSGFYVMRPDGSSLRELPIRPAPGDWAWSPTEEAIYALERDRLYRVALDGHAPRAIWTAEPATAQRDRWRLSLSAFSPDGRWITLVESWDASENKGDYITAAALHAVRTDGKESLLLGSWQPVPHRLHQPDQPDRMGGYVRVRSVWDSTGRALYAAVCADGRRSHLLRWRPGSDASLIPIGPELPYRMAFLYARRNADEVLVWPHAGWGQRAQYGPFLLGPDGRSQPIPDAVSAVKFANENSVVTFDDTGRLITIAGPRGRQALMATDLNTGKTERIYP